MTTPGHYQAGIDVIADPGAAGKGMITPLSMSDLALWSGPISMTRPSLTLGGEPAGHYGSSISLKDDRNSVTAYPAFPAASAASATHR